MTSQLTLTASQDTHLRLLVNEPPSGDVHGEVLLAPVFGGTARSMFAFAHALTMNGFRSIRIDFRDHVGKSTGLIANARLSRQAEDIALAAGQFPGSTLVGISLSARSAARAVGQGVPVSGTVLVTPVVDVRNTLIQVLERDYFGADFPSMPASLTVLDYEINDSFIHDARESRLSALEGVIDDLDSGQHLTLVAGDADPWVDIADVRAVAGGLQASGRTVDLVTVPAASHRLDRNPAVALRYVEETVRACLRHNGLTVDPVMPTFDDIVQATLADSVLAARPFAEVRSTS